MKLIKIDVNGKQIEFVCDARNTRYGFAHDATLFVNGNQWGKASCFYLNRTWESWTYQAVCKTACYEEIGRLAVWIKNTYKSEHGLSRVCGKRKAEVEALIDADPAVVLLREALRILESRSF